MLDLLTIAYVLQGHSVTRKLGSDGKVESVQTLRNLNEGELCTKQRWCTRFCSVAGC